MEEEKILGRSLCTQYPDFTNKEMKDQNAEWYVTGYSQVRPGVLVYSKQVQLLFFPPTVPHAFAKQKLIQSVKRQSKTPLAGILTVRVTRKWDHRFGPHFGRLSDSNLSS